MARFGGSEGQQRSAYKSAEARRSQITNAIWAGMWSMIGKTFTPQDLKAAADNYHRTSVGIGSVRNYIKDSIELDWKHQPAEFDQVSRGKYQLTLEGTKQAIFMHYLRRRGTGAKQKKFDELGLEARDQWIAKEARSLMQKSNPLPSNEYGNIDIRHGVPAGFEHVSGKRLTLACKKLNIECMPALVGWKKSGRYTKPKLDGVVLTSKNAKKLKEYLASKKPKTSDQRVSAKIKKQIKETSVFIDVLRQQFPGMPEYDIKACAAHATTIGSGRVGRSTISEDPAKAAVIAYIRHTYTDYDDLLADGVSQHEARKLVGQDIHDIFSRWMMDRKANPPKTRKAKIKRPVGFKPREGGFYLRVRRNVHLSGKKTLHAGKRYYGKLVKDKVWILANRYTGAPCHTKNAAATWYVARPGSYDLLGRGYIKTRGRTNPPDLWIKAAHKYKSPRQGKLTKQQAHVRKVAYGLKTGQNWAVAEAAKEMAKLVQPGDVLVPIPSLTSMSISPNHKLCQAIDRELGDGLLVVPAVDSHGRRQGQLQRHKRGLPPHDVEDIPFHSLISASDIPDGCWVFLVDNVCTSGNTIRAAVKALNRRDAIGLVYADARGTI